MAASLCSPSSVVGSALPEPDIPAWSDYDLYDNRQRMLHVARVGGAREGPRGNTVRHRAKAVAAPATVSGEPFVDSHWRLRPLGRRRHGEDPRARRPAAGARSRANQPDGAFRHAVGRVRPSPISLWPATPREWSDGGTGPSILPTRRRCVPRRRDCACPGLFRIVAARDGGICRIKLPLGHLSGAEARAVAEAAARFGNGDHRSDQPGELANPRRSRRRRGRADPPSGWRRARTDAAGSRRHPQRHGQPDGRHRPAAASRRACRSRVIFWRLIESARRCRVAVAEILLPGRWRRRRRRDRPSARCLAGEHGRRRRWRWASPESPPARGGRRNRPLSRSRRTTPSMPSRRRSRFLPKRRRRDPEVARFRHLFARVSRERFFDRLAERLAGRGRARRGDCYLGAAERRRRSGMSASASSGRRVGVRRRRPAARAPVARPAGAARRDRRRVRRRQHPPDALAQRDHPIRRER